MKPCNKCGDEKALSDFYKSDNSCKECRKVMVRANYRRNREHYLAYERTRKRDPKRVKARQEYAKRNSRRLNHIKKEWEMRNPEKKAANITLGNAIKRGEVVKKPCVVCCTTENVQGHHEDYSKPLDVIWMCAKHHAEFHVVKREAERVYGEAA